MSSSGLETATFHSIAQCLNQQRYRVPQLKFVPLAIFHYATPIQIVQIATFYFLIY
jgi:hypothetical protein